MNEIGLLEELQNLIDNEEENCLQVENRALDTLCAVEIPTFSVLRHCSAQKCHYILCRMRDWFGSTPTKEHYLCLLMVTDYVSCSYQNTDFYGTFIKEKQDKFYESFFVKLSNEWKALFHKMPIAVLPSLEQFNSLRSSLHASLDRFSKKFLFKGLLSDITNSCEDYGSRLEKHLSNLESKQELRVSVDILNKTPPVLTSNSSTTIRITSNVKSSTISIPCKVLNRHKSSTSNPTRNLVHTPSIKRYSLPLAQLHCEPKKLAFGVTSLVDQKRTTDAIMLGDSPIKEEKTSLKLDNITNLVPSSLKRPAETSDLLKSLISNNKQLKHQDDVALFNNAKKGLSANKLNAFDILMRRKVIKIVS